VNAAAVQHVLHVRVGQPCHPASSLPVLAFVIVDNADKNLFLFIANQPQIDLCSRSG